MHWLYTKCATPAHAHTFSRVLAFEIYRRPSSHLVLISEPPLFVVSSLRRLFCQDRRKRSSTVLTRRGVTSVLDQRCLHSSATCIKFHVPSSSMAEMQSKLDKFVCRTMLLRIGSRREILNYLRLHKVGSPQRMTKSQLKSKESWKHH